jgi:hypothetical protein
MQTQADHEYDSEAPYGRKSNGTPYKTKPSMRMANQKYHANNREAVLESKRRWANANKELKSQYTKKWQKENREKANELSRNAYYRKKAELEYYKELFTLSLETI